MFTCDFPVFIALGDAALEADGGVSSFTGGGAPGNAKRYRACTCTGHAFCQKKLLTLTTSIKGTQTWGVSFTTVYYVNVPVFP